MTWQGAGGTGGPGETPGQPDDATRTDWTVGAPPPANAAPDLPDPFAPGGPLAEDAPGPVAAPLPAAPPAAPMAPPVAPPPFAPAPSAPGGTPWAPPVEGGGSWGTPPAGGQYAVPGAPGLVYAGALPRTAAWIVDSFIVGIVAAIASAPFAASVAFDANGAPDFTQMAAQGGISAIISTIISAAYFVFLWTTNGRATLGMRLFNLQVGNASDGAKLRMDQAGKRWLALGAWLSIIPIVGILQAVWQLVLLITTTTSPTKQGMHDRFAESAVVRPAAAGNGLAITCLVVALIGPILLAVIAVAALVSLGGQVSEILSAVGDSI